MSAFALIIFIYIVILSVHSRSHFIYDEKSSSILEGVFRGYTGFHGYNEPVGFFLE